MRYFITPKMKCKWTNEVKRGQCWRKCGEQMADHFHIFWNCPAIQPYWQEITQALQSIFGNDIDCSFVTIYLGNNVSCLSAPDKYLIKVLLAASKKAVTQMWLHPTPPTKTDWIEIVTDIQSMERLTFSLDLRTEKFLQYWMKWIVYASLREDY